MSQSNYREAKLQAQISQNGGKPVGSDEGCGFDSSRTCESLKLDESAMDRVSTYHSYCSDLEQMTDNLSKNGEFLVAARLQSAIDELRSVVGSMAGNNGI